MGVNIKSTNKIVIDQKTYPDSQADVLTTFTGDEMPNSITIWNQGADGGAVVDVEITALVPNGTSIPDERVIVFEVPANSTVETATYLIKQLEIKNIATKIFYRAEIERS